MESVRKFKYHQKMALLITLIFFGLILFILAFLIFGSIISQLLTKPAPNIKYGVSYSPLAAKSLKLDWQKTYTDILDDLKVRYIRIPSYWTSIESKVGEFDFSETDYLVQQAEKRNVQLILTLGIKQPRWPECHVPKWVRSLSTEKRQQKTLELITKVVQRYKSSNSIYAWQVENEPFYYPYGEDCFPPDEKFLKLEVETVKSLDSRPVIISETGELAMWGRQMKASDIFGTTLYRTVFNQTTGYFNYPLIPGYYSLRSYLFRKFLAPQNQKTIIVELQAEPWLAKNNPLTTPLGTQMKIFSPQDLQKNIQFAQKTGFDEIYLWGVEWWYFLKQQGQPQYWDLTKTYF